MSRDEKLKAQLMELYPDRVVKNLRQEHHNLYQNVNNAKIRKGLKTIDDYLEQLGFKNVTVKKSLDYDVRLERVLKGLNETFPDKKIPNYVFNDKGIYKKLYTDLYNLEKKNYHKFLAEHQFVFVDIDLTKCDARAIDILQKEYKVDEETFSKLFSLSKRNVDTLISQKNTSKTNWIIDDLSEVKLNIFTDMIKTRTSYKIIERETFYICSNRNVLNPKFALLHIVKNSQVDISCKCLLNVPETLIQLLQYYHFHLLEPLHLEYLQHFVQINEASQSENQKYYLDYTDRLYANHIIRGNPSFFKDFNSLKKFFRLEYIKDNQDVEYYTMYDLIASYYHPELDAVHIPIKDRTNYDKVRNTGKQKYDLQMKDFVECFGFNYKGKLKKVEMKMLNYDYDADEEIDKKLRELQAKVKEKTISQEEKLARSRTLVKSLKEFYDYKCQLCDENSPIPPILYKDGRNYVEVHHIVPLKEQGSFNDESDIILDDYKNAMVVCPHHHKYLHFHLGGFQEIKRKNNTYYFENEHEELFISTNHHLEENHDLLNKQNLSHEVFI